ncbi:MAG: hypothetical protein KKC20_10250 [Proteobacteria bacterium]|nr:hypothetical protein [Pseudomonadota bacterium]
MTTERLIWQGQKQEKVLEAKRLETSIEGLRSGIRTELNPHAPISEINHDLLTQQAFEMADKLILHKKICAEIAAINRSLGI